MIYTITAYPPARDSDGLIPNGRVFGYLPTLDAAMEAVITDAADMHECLYTHIVIEEVPPGIHALAAAVQWFTWCDEGDGGWWQLCAAPEWSRGIINHSMG